MSKSLKNDQDHDFVKACKRKLSKKNNFFPKSKKKKHSIFLTLGSCAKNIFFFSITAMQSTHWAV